MNQRYIIYVMSALMLLSQCKAQQQDQGRKIVSMLESMGNGESSTEQEFYGAVNELSLSRTFQDDIRRILDLARKLMDRPEPQLQRYGAYVFLTAEVVPSRDGGTLIMPFLPDLEQLAAKPANSNRPVLLMVMSLLQPVPKRTLEFMSSQLNDKNNSLDESNLIMATLLKSGLDLYTRQVIEYAKKADYPRQDAALRQMGLESSRNAEVLDFIRWSFWNTKATRAGIDAVSRLPRKDRLTFSDLLTQVSLDSKEAEDVRGAAREELKLQREAGH